MAERESSIGDRFLRLCDSIIRCPCLSVPQTQVQLQAPVPVLAQVQALPVPVQVLPVLAPVLKELSGPDPVVVAPDSGSAKMAMYYGDLLGGGFAVVAKRRINATTVASSHLVGDVRDKVCIITDDLTSTCGTLCAAAKILKDNGAAKIYASVTHCLLNEDGKRRLLETPEIEQLITTDAVPQRDTLGGKIRVVSVAPLLGEAIRRIHDGQSVSSLFYIQH